MRLTLRTLLAYMDDILEPQDHEELEKRIESSDFANDLIHRTRDTMRRLRLSAPPIKGEGMGLDPNTVAEYLDNTLEADQVPDFERVCLESDVHLSEAASCHHVLTMVLGEPAEIDPDLRRRMYALPTQGIAPRKLRIEPLHQSPVVAPIVHTEMVDMSAGIASASAAAAPVRRVEVPDYLRAAETSLWKRLLPAIAAVLVLSTVSYFAFREGGWLRAPKQVAVNTMGTTPLPVDTAPSADTVAPMPAQPADGLENPPGLDEGSEPLLPTDEMPVGVPEAGQPGVSPPETTVDSGAPTDSIPMPAEEEPVSPPVNSEQSPETTIATPSPRSETPVPSVPLPPVPSGEGAIPEPKIPAPDGGVTSEAPLPPQPLVEMPAEGTTVAEGTDPPTSVDPLEPAGPPTMGTFSSTRQVLLTQEPDGTWRRLPPRAPIIAGSELLSLPTYRPLVALATGMNAELLGGTLIRVDAADAAAPASSPRLNVVYGQVLLINTSMTELALPIQIGEVSATVKLQPNATLAIDAHRLFQPGNDAAKVPAPVAAALYAPAGGLVWESPDAKLDVATPGMWQLAGDSVGPVQAYEATAWIDGEPLDYWEQMSSPAIERLITTNQPVSTQLLGLYENTKRKEEKALLAKCSMHVGQFVPFLRSLNDPNQAPQWDQQITALRMAMARSPELAQRVFDTLVVELGADKAPDLYQLLCGYSPAQVGTSPEEVQAGALKELIDWLENDQLIYRVLAFHNLKEITGKPLTYNPTATEDARMRAVKIWRLRLKDNELMPSP